MTQTGEELLSSVAEIAREEQLLLDSQEIDDAAFAELGAGELAALASAVCERTLERRPAVVERGVKPRRRQGPIRLAWLAAAALLGAGVWLARLELAGPPQVARGTLSTEGERLLSLPDGSTLALAEHTDARIVALDPHEVRVQLVRGSVECEVAHDPERRFVVAAGSVEVVVRGTRFTVSSGLEASAPEQVSVSVQRGLVEVRQPPDHVLASLGAGESWSSNGRALPEPIARRPLRAPSPQIDSRPDAGAPERAASPELGASPASPPKPAPSSARALFERADAERLAGHPRQAAAAFDQLRRNYPTDARAGYAAFMLGRIRLDSLDDPNGAAEAFAFAIAHPGGGVFVEDAKARRVEALDAAGRANECRAAREQFLAEHPRAVRAAFVAKLCGERSVSPR